LSKNFGFGLDIKTLLRKPARYESTYGSYGESQAVNVGVSRRASYSRLQC